jgi:hypothetical protein
MTTTRDGESEGLDLPAASCPTLAKNARMGHPAKNAKKGHPEYWECLRDQEPGGPPGTGRICASNVVHRCSQWWSKVSDFIRHSKLYRFFRRNPQVRSVKMRPFFLPPLDMSTQDFFGTFVVDSDSFGIVLESKSHCILGADRCSMEGENCVGGRYPFSCAQICYCCNGLNTSDVIQRQLNGQSS